VHRAPLAVSGNEEVRVLNFFVVFGSGKECCLDDKNRGDCGRDISKKIGTKIIIKALFHA